MRLEIQGSRYGNSRARIHCTGRTSKWGSPMNIAVFGLGKLGAPLAALLGSKGHQVVGVDIDRRQTDAMNIGIWDSPEPQ
ncbi:MAG TPA: NAD(P)-binding domain-containing protein, partial [Desulfosporosinus sp.]|nr:NAD(P)-binding domain-containing protein [Desulfosporosinus sp.]